MMSRSRHTFTAAIMFVCTLCATAGADPHIAIAEARKIALARVPGAIVHEKLKHESKKKQKKGKHDHYNFKVRPRDHAKNDTTLKKIEIDAETGAILEIKDVKAKSYD